LLRRRGAAAFAGVSAWAQNSLTCRMPAVVAADAFCLTLRVAAALADPRVRPAMALVALRAMLMNGFFLVPGFFIRATVREFLVGGFPQPLTYAQTHRRPKTG
jgi:hypothetical protein